MKNTFGIEVYNKTLIEYFLKQYAFLRNPLIKQRLQTTVKFSGMTKRMVPSNPVKKYKMLMILLVISLHHFTEFENFKTTLN